MAKYRRWTDSEIEYLKKWFGVKPVEEIADYVGRTPDSVKDYAYTHGIRMGRYMTEEQKQYIREHYKTESLDALSKKLGFNKTNIAKFCASEGLFIKRWTKKEIEFLRENIGLHSRTYIAKKLGKTVRSVSNRAHKEGLTFRDCRCDYTQTDVANMLGWSKKRAYLRMADGRIRTKHIGKLLVTTDKWLCDYMKANTEEWDATECDYYSFNRYDWFQDKLKADSKKKRDERWKYA